MALFQQLSYAFLRQTLLQGCIIESKILRSPMILYPSLPLVATAINAAMPSLSYFIMQGLLHNVTLKYICLFYISYMVKLLKYNIIILLSLIVVGSHYSGTR